MEPVRCIRLGDPRHLRPAAAAMSSCTMATTWPAIPIMAPTSRRWSPTLPWRFRGCRWENCWS